VYCFARIGQGRPGFIWARLGIANAVPKSNDLALQIAAANRNLMVGRVYLASGGGLAMVVLEGTVFHRALVVGAPATLADVESRIVTAAGHAGQLRQEIVNRFGGRAFGGEDWRLLIM
jgi:hypothetical protein